MEIIRKKICIEDSRSRIQGLLPYIPYNVDIEDENEPFIFLNSNSIDGNYGGFVANPMKTKTEGDIFENLMNDYNRILKNIRNGIRLRKVVKQSGVIWVESTYEDGIDTYNYYPFDKNDFSGDINGIYTWLGNSGKTNPAEYSEISGITLVDDYDFINNVSKKYSDKDYADFTFCKIMEGNYIGKLQIPRTIQGEKVPDFICYPDIKEYYEWMLYNQTTKDCCSKKLWEDRGGFAMLNFLRQHTDTYVNAIVNAANFLKYDSTGKVKKECIPFISIPLFLKQDIDNLGEFTDYIETDEEDYAYNKTLGKRTSGLTEYVAESNLEQFRIGELLYDDYGNLLPGYLTKHATKGTLYYQLDNGSWKRCGASTASKTDYVSSTILETINNTFEMELGRAPKNGDYCLVKYGDYTDNKLVSYLHMPYLTPGKGGVIKNVYDLEDGNKMGDFIISNGQSNNGTIITFKYVIGGHYLTKDDGSFKSYINGTGIVYEEAFPFSSGETFITQFEGVKVEFKYDKIDFESKTTLVYSDDIGEHVTRKAIESNIKEYTLNDIWNPNEAINAPIFKEDYLMGFTDGIIGDVDIEINRGAASAFEKHFKLAECNTFEDLENNSNNYFNL